MDGGKQNTTTCWTACCILAPAVPAGRRGRGSGTCLPPLPAWRSPCILRAVEGGPHASLWQRSTGRSCVGWRCGTRGTPLPGGIGNLGSQPFSLSSRPRRCQPSASCTALLSRAPWSSPVVRSLPRSWWCWSGCQPSQRGRSARQRQCGSGRSRAQPLVRCHHKHKPAAAARPQTPALDRPKGFIPTLAKWRQPSDWRWLVRAGPLAVSRAWPWKAYHNAWLPDTPAPYPSTARSVAALSLRPRSFAKYLNTVPWSSTCRPSADQQKHHIGGTAWQKQTLISVQVFKRDGQESKFQLGLGLCCWEPAYEGQFKIFSSGQIKLDLVKFCSAKYRPAIF